MLLVRACATPQPQSQPRLPKRLARARRVMESKRMDSFRSIHEALKKTAKEEQEFLKGFFKNSKMFDDEESDEEEPESEDIVKKEP